MNGFDTTLNRNWTELHAKQQAQEVHNPARGVHAQALKNALGSWTIRVVTNSTKEIVL